MFNINKVEGGSPFLCLEKPKYQKNLKKSTLILWRAAGRNQAGTEALGVSHRGSVPSVWGRGKKEAALWCLACNHYQILACWHLLAAYSHKLIFHILYSARYCTSTHSAEQTALLESVSYSAGCYNLVSDRGQ